MNKTIERIYFKAPPLFKNIAVSFIGYCNKAQRKGHFYKKQYQNFLTNWELDEIAFRNIQIDILRDLLKEVNLYSTYYRSIFNSMGINESAIVQDPIEVLSKMPFLLKDTLKNDIENLINSNPKRSKDFKNFTSGTSGSPTTSYYDKESMQISAAFLRRFYYFIGLKDDDFKSVRFSGKIIIHPDQSNPPFWVYNYLDKQLFASSYHLKESNFPDYIGILNRLKPKLLDGYPSAIYVLSKFINQNAIKLAFNPTAIATTAETLFDYQREEIEQAFNCKVYNQYASSEGGAFITECSQGRLHLNMDSGIFEFINEDGNPAIPGEIAELVITSFRSWKTPLIRYKTGDSVRLSESQIGKCGCGTSFPHIEEIIGRSDDILYTEAKGFVGRMDPAYKGLYGIVKSQIIQKSISDIEVIQIVDEKYNDKVEKLLIDNLKDRLGDEVNIVIKLVDEIPLGANGKFKSVSREFDISDL